MTKPPVLSHAYEHIHSSIVDLLESARRETVRSVNALMTACYWEIGRRIVEEEQGGAERATYGQELIERLSKDLTARFGRGFSDVNLRQMRNFYLCWPHQIQQTLSAVFEGEIQQTLSAISAPPISELATEPPVDGILQAISTEPHPPGQHAPVLYLQRIAQRFRLPWSAYVRLLSVKSPEARSFYEQETLRNGWSVRQLDRQISSQFYERAALSRDKAAMLAKNAPEKADSLLPEEAIKDPFVLEFLGLKDEYSESDLEEALIHNLTDFLLELGDDFAFVGRQRRLRLDDSWFRVDLLFFHRRLQCLIIIDLKVGRFSYADAGQMHMYLNYAREHWMKPGENPPIGIILCAGKGEAEARYALDNLPGKVLAAEYRTMLPDEQTLAAELKRTQQELEHRKQLHTPTEDNAGGEA